MKKGQQGSFVNRAGRQVLHSVGVFSKIWFWFPLIVIAYLILAGYDLLDMRYTRREWWDDFYSISSAFLVGGLISFFFYFLVVFIPEQKKRRIIKTNLRKM